MTYHPLSFQEKKHINGLFIQQKLWQNSILQSWGINTVYFTDSHVPAKFISPEVMGVLLPGTPGVGAGSNYWAKMRDSMVLKACNLLEDSSATQFHWGKIFGVSKVSADFWLLSSFTSHNPGLH